MKSYKSMLRALALTCAVAATASFILAPLAGAEALPKQPEVRTTQFRRERLYIQSQHASEPDPVDRRLDRNPADPQSVRNPALCVAV